MQETIDASSSKGLHPACTDEEWGFAPAPVAPMERNRKQPQRFNVMLLMPAVLVLAFISLYPFFWLIYMSFHKVNLGPRPNEWVGLKNFSRLATDDRFIDGWITLLKYSAICLTIEVIIGVALAIMLNQSRHEKVLITLFLMPMMMSPVVAGLLWFYLYNGTFGWYHWLFQSLGILGETSILASPNTALAGIILIDVWQWTPLITLITLAGLKRVPQDQFEASMVDGSGTIQNFLSVTLPNIVPFLLIAILLRFMDNFRFIDHILATTGGGPGDSTRLLPVYLFDISFKFFKLGRGAAVALTLLVVTIILGLILVKIFEDPARKRQMAGGDG